MSNLQIQDLLRAGGVDRWHIVRTTQRQSLAEHTFNVVMIARAICKEAHIPDEKVIKAALEHDLDEIVYGDIPTPTKSKLKHKVNINDLIDNTKHNDLSDTEKNIVKIADMLEACWFIHEFKTGRHAEAVAIEQRSYFHEYVAVLDCEDLLPFNVTNAVYEVVHKIERGEFTI